MLNTQGFTLEEVNLLINVLTDKFNLKCTINKNSGHYVIRISSKTLPVLQIAKLIAAAYTFNDAI